MLAPSTPLWGLPCGIPRFWRLRVAKDFPKPEYYIGQTVLHRTKLRDREIFTHVDVLGVAWSGCGWQYLVEFPSKHPYLDEPDTDSQWVDNNELGSVFTSSDFLMESVREQKEKLIESVGAQLKLLNIALLLLIR